MAQSMTTQTIHVDVRLSPEERQKAILELAHAKEILKERKMESVVLVVDQLITSMNAPSSEELVFEPMPEVKSEEVVASFRSAGKYSEGFLQSLEQGLKRLASQA